MAKKRITPTFTLKMSSSFDDATSVTILTDTSEILVSNTLNYIVKGLEVAKFRGCVIFALLQNDLMKYSAVVTFSDDFPAGAWNLTRFD